MIDPQLATPTGLSRRRLLTGSLAAGSAVALGGASRAQAAPALVRSGRPMLTHGVQSGDVGAHAATVWARADRPSRAVVEISDRPDFRRVRRISGSLLLPGTDFTGDSRLRGLPAGRDLHYRVRATELHDHDRCGPWVEGRLRTAQPRGRRARRDVSFVWSGDLGGQGWGIDVSRGGYRIFDAMRALDPDFYLCNGDNIYADDPIEEHVTLPDGSIWTNLVTEEKSKVAETLAEYRGNYKYNLLDEPLKRFYAEVAQIQQWDDHETHNNWYPGEIIPDPLYTEKRADVLARRARQAYFEYTPMNPTADREGRIYRVLHQGPLLDVFVLDMRSYRNANSVDTQTTDPVGILGVEQARWLQRELAASTATWKVISNDMPMAEVVKGTEAGVFEAISQGDDGRPLGRELQIAELLRFIKRRAIRNVVWLTTDVHYTAAEYFDPATAAFGDFDPFWQFVSGPLNSGSFPADALDTTFGARRVFLKAPTVANASPATEYQFFGQVGIDAESEAMTVRLRDNSGAVLFTQQLDPVR